MNFLKKIMHYYVRAIRETFKFNGCASREYYWSAFLGGILILPIKYLLDFVFGNLMIPIKIFMTISRISMLIKRLRDVGKNPYKEAVIYFSLILLIFFLSLMEPHRGDWSMFFIIWLYIVLLGLIFRIFFLTLKKSANSIEPEKSNSERENDENL